MDRRHPAGPANDMTETEILIAVVLGLALIFAQGVARAAPRGNVSEGHFEIRLNLTQAANDYDARSIDAVWVEDGCRNETPYHHSPAELEALVEDAVAALNVVRDSNGMDRYTVGWYDDEDDKQP